MSNIFPTDFDEKTTIAENDYVLFSDSEDGDKLKKAKYSNLKGEKGDTGATGSAATISVGTTTTGEPGTAASVSNSGTSSAAVFNFTIPKGAKGDKGDTGNTGSAATITVGTTTTGDAGTSASVTNSGTTSAAVLDFTIPKGSKGDQGDPGEDGASIVSVAFDEDDMVFTDSNGDTVTLEGAKTDLKGDKGDTGNTGPTGASIVSAAFSSNDIVFTKDDSNTVTLTDAKIELKGDKGDKGNTGNTGPTGASIVSAAFSGNDIVFTKDDSNTVTLADAKTTLKGDQGDKGDTGNTGAAATITVGSTTTGQAGTSASVTNSGTTSAAVLDFTIPKGDKGDQGVQGEQGEQGETGNGIASITSSKSGKNTTVTITETDGDSTSFVIQDGADGQGSGDMSASIYDPNNVAANAFDYTNFINTPSLATVATSGDYTDLTNKPTIPAAQVNSDWNSASGVSQILNKPTLGTAASKNTGTSSGNVPVLDSNGKLDNSVLPAVALVDTFTVTNKSDLTSLSSADQGDIGIVTSESKTYVLSVAPYSTAANWKELLTPTDAVTSVNTKTGAVTLTADDISDSSTTNKFVTATDKSTWNGKQDALSTQTAYTSKGSATKVPQITTNSLGQVTGITEVTITQPTVPTKVSDLDNDAGYITSSSLPGKASSSTTGTVKLGSDTTQSVSANAVSGTASRTYAIQTNSSDQLVVNVPWEDHTYTASSFDIKDLADSTSLRTTWSGKQDALTTQTAYTTKGTSTKVPTITTNSLGQVTAITETDITYPSQVDDTAYAASWDGVTATAPSKNAVYDKISSMDTTIGGKQDKATSGSTAPSSTPSYIGQVYVDTTNSKMYVAVGTSSSSDWFEVGSGSGVQISSQANNVFANGAKLWGGTESNYSSLGTYSNDTVYLTY